MKIAIDGNSKELIKITQMFGFRSWLECDFVNLCFKYLLNITENSCDGGMNRSKCVSIQCETRVESEIFFPCIDYACNAKSCLREIMSVV